MIAKNVLDGLGASNLRGRSLFWIVAVSVCLFQIEPMQISPRPPVLPLG